MCLRRLPDHLGLKDMQRFGPDVRKNLYVTAPVVSRSLGSQVVSISQKRIKIGSTMSTDNSRVCVDDFKDSYDPSRK